MLVQRRAAAGILPPDRMRAGGRRPSSFCRRESARFFPFCGDVIAISELLPSLADGTAKEEEDEMPNDDFLILVLLILTAIHGS